MIYQQVTKLIGFYHLVHANVNKQLMLTSFKRLSTEHPNSHKFPLNSVSITGRKPVTSGKFGVSSSVLCHQHNSAALWPDPRRDKNISRTPACADGRSAWLVTTRCLLEEASVMNRRLRRENSAHRTNGRRHGGKNPEQGCCCYCGSCSGVHQRN